MIGGLNLIIIKIELRKNIDNMRKLNDIPIKPIKSKILKIFGLKLEIWKVIQGHYLTVDTKTTRYIFKPIKYVGKCNTCDLI